MANYFWQTGIVNALASWKLNNQIPSVLPGANVIATFEIGGELSGSVSVQTIRLESGVFSNTAIMTASSTFLINSGVTLVVQNGALESLNGRMRDELVDDGLFLDLDQGRQLIDARIANYNRATPSSRTIETCDSRYTHRVAGRNGLAVAG